jgi:hypothetical protein
MSARKSRRAGWVKWSVAIGIALGLSTFVDRVASSTTSARVARDSCIRTVCAESHGAP